MWTPTRQPFNSLRALAIGAATELFLLAPLYAVSFSGAADVVPIQLWIRVLEAFQRPGYPLVERLFKLHVLSPFFAHHRDLLRSWLISVEVLEFVIQTLLIAVLAFVVISISQSATIRSLNIRRKTFLGFIVGLPISMMLLGTVLVFPYYLVDFELAETIIMVSAIWFGVTAFVIVTARLGPRTTT